MDQNNTHQPQLLPANPVTATGEVISTHLIGARIALIDDLRLGAVMVLNMAEIARRIPVCRQIEWTYPMGNG